MHSPPLGRKAGRNKKRIVLAWRDSRTVLTETDLQGAAYIDV